MDICHDSEFIIKRFLKKRAKIFNVRLTDIQRRCFARTHAPLPACIGNCKESQKRKNSHRNSKSKNRKTEALPDIAIRPATHHLQGRHRKQELAMQEGLIVLVGIQFGKQDFRKTKAAEIFYTHRIEYAVEMIAFMLHHACVKTFSITTDHIAELVHAFIVHR